MSACEASGLDDQAIEFLVRLHSGAAPADLVDEFQHWRAQSAAHEQAAREAEALWAALPRTRAAARHRQTRRPRWRLPALATAACLLVALGLQLVEAPLSGLYADHRTAIGERRMVELEDGSRVWLNSDSALAVDFSHQRRDLRLLRGEALFEVVSDPERPFVVEAAAGEVRAVGTRFDVDNRGGRVRVDVSEGVVQVASGAGEPVRLVAGERLSYREGTAPGAVQALELASASAWQRGKLIFNRQPLGEVLDELERYLPGRILLTDAQLRRHKVSGVFDLGDPQALLDTLERLQPVSIARLPWLIVVRPAARG